MKWNAKDKSREEIDKLLSEAWLNVVFNEDTLFNPLMSVPSDFEDDFHLYILYLMSRPEYFSFFCKEILNIELLPFQAVILSELWKRKFPMVIASRGAGKCITGDSLIITQNGFEYIGDYVGRDSCEITKKYSSDFVLNKNGIFKNIEYSWNNGFSETIKLETSQGYSLEGTFNHPIMVIRNGKEEWVELQNIKIDDYVLIDRIDNWFENTNDINEDLAYFFGSLIGDGGYTVRGRISFTSADEESHALMNTIAIKYFNKSFIKCSKYSRNLYSVDIWDSLFTKYGFNSFVCGEKSFPKCMLKAKKSSMASFISGLFDTDGNVSKTRKIIEYCSKSEHLVKTLQIVLTKFGIISRRKKRLNKKYNTYYWYLYITGNNVNLFKEKIGFVLKRKQDLLNKVCCIKTNTNIDIYPVLSNKKNRKYYGIDKAIKLGMLKNNNNFYDKVKTLERSYNQTFDIHIDDSDHSFISNGIISHNSFILALYALLRCVFIPGRKVIIAGAGFRQSKLVFDYCVSIWNNAPLLRDFMGSSSVNGPKYNTDACRFVLNDASITAIPVGDGKKIRGYRSSDLISDEFGSNNPEIFEEVLVGFGAVSTSPVKNVKIEARKKLAEKLQFDLDDPVDDTFFSNQLVISGTAQYYFNHFYKYWKLWHSIVKSKGHKTKLQEIFKEGIPEDLNWKDYSVIRFPVDILPYGFMDAGQLARSKATLHSGLYGLEFGATFSVDSDGFFKASLIQSCVADNHNLIVKAGSDEPIIFKPKIYGDRNREYIYAVDPASEQDNFAVTILEIWPDHRRIVYCWTTNSKDFKEKRKSGEIKETDFYGYCARKIRDLMKTFPTNHIAIDAAGGGKAVYESLHQAETIKPGEQMIWEVMEPGVEKDCDGEEGLHIIHLIQFSKEEFTSGANHGMKKDFEDKKILFPEFDMSYLSLFSTVADTEFGDVEERFTNEATLIEDCILEIEELKKELTQIIVTSTATGRERFDTPEIKLPGSEKGRLRKDRYSALLMANWIARNITEQPSMELSFGGFASNVKTSPGKNFAGPSWLVNKLNEMY